MPPTKHTLIYPGHFDPPIECLNFIYMRGFEAEWRDLGFDDNDLQALEVAIMAKPDRFPVIQGTGGLRKLRFTSKGKGRNKKSCRVCYVFFAEARTVVVYIAYAKHEKDNLSVSDKNFIGSMIKREHMVLSNRLVR